jgi:hypothetical protein
MLWAGSLYESLFGILHRKIAGRIRGTEGFWNFLFTLFLLSQELTIQSPRWREYLNIPRAFDIITP